MSDLERPPKPDAKPAAMRGPGPDDLALWNRLCADPTLWPYVSPGTAAALLLWKATGRLG